MLKPTPSKWYRSAIEWEVSEAKLNEFRETIKNVTKVKAVLTIYDLRRWSTIKERVSSIPSINFKASLSI